jgi:hypothetical protein
LPFPRVFAREEVEVDGFYRFGFVGRSGAMVIEPHCALRALPR